MRLLVVSHTGLRSGAEIVLSRLVEGAQRRDWSVTALVPPGPAAENIASVGGDVVPLPNLTLPTGSKVWAGARLGAQCARAVPVIRRAGRQADVVVVNGLLGLPAVAAARLHAPVVWLVHDVVSRSDRMAMARLCRRSVRSAVAVSEVAAGPVRTMGFPVVVIAAGTPYPVPARSAPSPGGAAIVGCAAALTPWKGQDVLLEAFADLLSSGANATLELLGAPFPRDASYAEWLRRRAAAPDLCDRVSFLGFRPDPLSEIRRWTIAVSASIEPEALGLTTLEAMSVGVPVVGTALGATPQVLGDAGLLVPPGDPTALAASLRTLLQSPERWARCAVAGPARVADRYRSDRQVDRTLDLLAQIAGR